MDSKVNIISDSEHEVEVNLKYDEIQPEINEAYKEERKNIEMPGFRKGKVPMQMLKKLYGDAIEYKASEKIASKKFWDVVDKEGLKPISTPQLTDIDFQRGSKLFFKVKYEVLPNLELKNYTGLEIDKPIFKVKDEEVEREVNYIIKSNGKFEEADKVDGNDFKITVDLQRYDENGTPVVGTRSENMSIDLSDEKVNPQIPQNAQGKKVGDTFEFVFTDEHMHGEEKHKVDYKYEAEITKIEKLIPPELNEEFFKKATNEKASNLEELKNEIRENINSYYKNQSENIYTNSLLAEVVKNNDFTPPQGFVETVLDKLADMEIENARRQGQQTPGKEELKKQLAPKAEWNAKWRIILDNLAEKENIKVEDSELESIAKEESEKMGISADKLIKYYKDSNRTETMLEEKVIKFLTENNKAKEVDAEKIVKKEKEKKDKAK